MSTCHTTEINNHIQWLAVAFDSTTLEDLRRLKAGTYPKDSFKAKTRHAFASRTKKSLIRLIMEEYVTYHNCEIAHQKAGVKVPQLRKNGHHVDGSSWNSSFDRRTCT